MAGFLFVCTLAMNVTVHTHPRNSVILRWEPPRSTGKTPSVLPVDHYLVTWQGPTKSGSLEVLPYPSGIMAQIQPLLPTESYTITVLALGRSGEVLDTATLNNVQPRGTMEAWAQESVKGGGVWYDPNRDRPHHIPTSDFWHISMSLSKQYNHRWQPVEKDGYWVWGHNGFYINHQSPAHHGHLSCTDFGGGVVSARLEAPLDMSLLAERSLHWFCDSDRGPSGRQAGYVIFTANKHDIANVTPSNDSGSTSCDPEFEIRLKYDSLSYPYDGPVVYLSVFAKGVLIGSAVSSRGVCRPNVRQVTGIEILPDRVRLLIDKDYDGVPEIAKDVKGNVTEVLYDMTTAPPQLWSYITIGSYNQAKINQQYGWLPDQTALQIDAIRQAFDTHKGEPGFDDSVDFVDDDVIDVLDLDYLIAHAVPRKLHRQYFCMLWHIDKVWHNANRTVKRLQGCCCNGVELDKPCPQMMKGAMAEMETTDPLLLMPPTYLLQEWSLPTVLLSYANWIPGKVLPTKLQVRAYADAFDSVRFSGIPTLIKSMQLVRINLATKAHTVLWGREFSSPRAQFSGGLTAQRRVDIKLAPFDNRECDLIIDTQGWEAGDYHLMLTATTVAGGTAFCYNNSLYTWIAPYVLKARNVTGDL